MLVSEQTVTYLDVVVVGVDGEVVTVRAHGLLLHCQAAVEDELAWLS